MESTDIGDIANLYNLRYVCCMVRQARLDAPGVLHHVMARGIERRPDLMGGGLYRSRRAVADLRRGREAYRSDERVLGSSAFVEALLEEADAQSNCRATSAKEIP